MVGGRAGESSYGGACEGRVGMIAFAVYMQCQGHGVVLIVQCREQFPHEIHIYNTVVWKRRPTTIQQCLATVSLGRQKGQYLQSMSWWL